MSMILDRTARRLIGVMIEKETTTPNAYPMTVNALASGANQKSNRSPVMDLQEFEVDGALKQMYIDQWVTNTSGAGSRVMKWKHRAAEHLGLDGVRLAIMAELFLRGAQQPGELRQRTSRMAPITDMVELERHLDALRELGLVHTLARQPGERVDRVDHTMYVEGEDEFLAENPAIEPAAPSSSEPATGDPRDEFLGRLTALEARVKSLEDTFGVGADDAADEITFPE